MNRFKISLLTIQHETGSNASKFILNTISEFYDQMMNADFPMEYTTFAYTYDEKFSIHTNAQKELSFKMDRYVTRSDAIEENPFTQNIVIGSQLLLEDTNARQHLLTVNKIGYTFYENNITYQYSCVDNFTYQLGRQNDGYTINNDVGTNDFLGSHTVDWWVQKIILPDCKISYTYKQLTEKVVEHGILVKRPIAQDSLYNRTVLFSGSGTANSILISLGESNELMLNTYEHYESDGTLTTYFWYEPKKHAENSGLRYSPYSDIKTFSLTHDGSSLSTVFNIQTHSINDNLISLFPPVTSFFSNYFLSDQWDNTSYSAGVFNNLAHGMSYHFTPSEHPLQLQRVDAYLNTKYTATQYDVSHTPDYNVGDYVYQSLFNSYYLFQCVQKQEAGSTPITPMFDVLHQFWMPCFYTQNVNSCFLILNSDIPTWITTYYAYMKFESLNGQISYYRLNNSSDRCYSSQHIWTLNSHDADYIWSSTDDLTYIIIDFNDTTFAQDTSFEEYDIYITFYRDPTAEDLEFATVADTCPWLENKLIDFSYHQTHNILNKPELQHLNQLIQQDLRKINGRLLVYAQDYYNALHQKTKLLSEIINNLDMIGATFESDVVQFMSKPGTMLDTSNFSKQCEYINEIYNRAQTNQEKIGMLNLSDTLSEYVNNYINHEQSFLKNMFNFRKYFDAPISILGQNNTLYKYTFEITNTKYNFYGVNPQPIKYTKTLKDDITQHPSVKLYYKQQEADIANEKTSYIPVSEQLLVDTTNFNHFYIPNITKGGYIPATQYVPNAKYYCVIFNGTWTDTSEAPSWTPQDITIDSYNFHVSKNGNKNVIVSVSDFNYVIAEDVDTIKAALAAGIDIGTTEISGTSYQISSKKFAWNVSYQQITHIAIIKNAWYKTSPRPSTWYVPVYDKYYSTDDWPNQNIIYNSAADPADTIGTIKPRALNYTCDLLNLFPDIEDIDADLFDASSAYKMYVKYFDTSLWYAHEDQDHIIHYYPTKLINATNESSSYRRVYTRTSAWQLLGTLPLGIIEAGAVYFISSGIKTLIKNNNNTNFNLSGSCKWDVDGNASAGNWKRFDGLIKNQLANNSDYLKLYFTKSQDAYNQFADLSDKWQWPQYIYPTYTTLDQYPSGCSTTNYYYKTNWLRVITEYDLVTRNSKYYIVNNAFLCNINQTGAIGVQKTPYCRLNKQLYYPLQSCMEVIDTAIVDWEKTPTITMSQLLQAMYGDTISYSTDGSYQWHDASDHYFYILYEENYDLDPASDTNIMTATKIIGQLNGIYRMIDISDLTNTTQWNGIYIVATEDSAFELATSYNETTTYYYSADGKTDFTRAYTYVQCEDFYYYPTKHYVMESFNNYNNITSLPYYEDNVTDIFSIRWQPCELRSDNKIYVNNNEIGTYTYTSKELNGLTNGEFWVQYHTKIDNPILIQYCSIVETNLTEYWQQAYAASKYCKFYLPESWLPRTDQGTNVFYQGIVNESKWIKDESVNPIIRATLASRYIPQVQPITNCARYVFKHHNTNLVLAQEITNYERTNLSYNDVKSITDINNAAISQMFINDLQLDLTQWFAIQQYDSYVYYQYIDGGTTWQQALDLFTGGLVSNEYFNGWDIMMINLLQSGYYINYEPAKYYEYQQKHDQLWRQLYQNYPSVILEKSFTYEDATNSRELLEAAQIAFNQYKQVERQYNIGIIKFDKLKGNSSQPLAIGDSIELQADEFYNGQDDISKSLTQLLFITDMSYTLRNPADMSITVNTIKYTDKVIKELLHLIR